MAFYAPPPDPTSPDLLQNTRLYLVSQGLVRLPDDGRDMTLPPLWIEPRYGVPAPLEETEGGSAVEVGQTVVAGINFGVGIPSKPYEGFLRNDTVMFTVRAINSQLAILFEQNVRVALNDKRGWTMQGVPVNESLLFRALTPLGRDEQGFTFMFEYLFSLWGPFTPVGP